MGKSSTRACGQRFVHHCAHCGQDILPGQEYRRFGRKKIHVRPDCSKAAAEVDYGVTEAPSEENWRSVLSDGPKTRLLWSCRHVARKYYDCWRCAGTFRVGHEWRSTIYPGDEYVREVYATPTGLRVYRSHTECPWPDDGLDPEAEEESLGEHDADEWELPLAA